MFFFAGIETKTKVRLMITESDMGDSEGRKIGRVLELGME